ncbi:MAG: hypothetical protein H7839_00315 [Magnetococcus sp. YQC-5]
MILMRVEPRPLKLFRFLTLSTVAMMFWMEKANAIDVAPRISDREIIQELVLIKAGQDKFNQRFEDINKRFDDINRRFDDSNKRFEDINKRFEDINKRFDDNNKRFDDINKRIEEVNLSLGKRIDDINVSLGKRIDDLNVSLGKRIDDLNVSLGKRIDDLNHLVLTLFGSLLSVMIAFIGFILWDRRTMLKPLEERIVQNTKDIHINRTLVQENTNMLNQVLLTLREWAKDDPKLSTVLRNFSLL